MKKTRLELTTQKVLIDEFIRQNPVRETAEKAGVNKNTVTKYFRWLRQIIYEKSDPPGFAEAIVKFAETPMEYVIERSRVHHHSLPVGLIFSNDKVYIGTIPQSHLPAKHPDRESIIADYTILPVKQFGMTCVAVKGKRYNRSIHVNVCDSHICPMKEHFGIKRAFCHYFIEEQNRRRGIGTKDFHLHLKEIEWRFNIKSRVEQRRTLNKLVGRELRNEMRVG